MTVRKDDFRPIGIEPADVILNKLSSGQSAMIARLVSLGDLHLSTGLQIRTSSELTREDPDINIFVSGKKDGLSVGVAIPYESGRRLEYTASLADIRSGEVGTYVTYVDPEGTTREDRELREGVDNFAAAFNIPLISALAQLLKRTLTHCVKSDGVGSANYQIAKRMGYLPTDQLGLELVLYFSPSGSN